MTDVRAQTEDSQAAGAGQVPMPPAMEVRLARASDVPVLAQVLARAFDDDPLFRVFTRHGEHRQERLAAFWAALLRFASDHLSDTYTTPDLAGVALWTPPGYGEGPLLDQLRLARPAGQMAGWRRLLSLLSAHATLQRRLVRHVPEPHYDLMVLGVEPARQGQGIGSALLRPILECCDRGHLCATLQTLTEPNLPLYERHGFHVAEETTIPGTTLPAWLMRRDPSSDTAVGPLSAGRHRQPTPVPSREWRHDADPGAVDAR